MDFQWWKYTFNKKWSKNGLVLKKNYFIFSTSRGGSRPQSGIFHFFNSSLIKSIKNIFHLIKNICQNDLKYLILGCWWVSCLSWPQPRQNLCWRMSKPEIFFLKPHLENWLQLCTGGLTNWRTDWPENIYTTTMWLAMMEAQLVTILEEIHSRGDGLFILKEDGFVMTKLLVRQGGSGSDHWCLQKGKRFLQLYKGYL